jgi:hypothetical protein
VYVSAIMSIVNDRNMVRDIWQSKVLQEMFVHGETRRDYDDRDVLERIVVSLKAFRAAFYSTVPCSFAHTSFDCPRTVR